MSISGTAVVVAAATVFKRNTEGCVGVSNEDIFQRFLYIKNFIHIPKSYFTEDKQLLHSNSVAKHLSLINRNCLRDTKCFVSLIKIPEESYKEIDETNMSKRINPNNLCITSSLSVMNPYKYDYVQITYPADRLKLSNLQIIVKHEEVS
ncbi:unnamed protein product [Schistosoma margrebowiei]|uniref:Uncharacterized protein n=1 Tax=Schistosoma margrebowiei TaxID=48269 RepID=A0AA85AMQ5_9TREM|nr:unnamed protein product [Schistosoma margrebowiei]